VRECGETRSHTERRYWNCGAAGETRSSNAGSAERREIRGDSIIRRRQGRKMQKPGATLGTSSRGASGGLKPRGNLKLYRWKRRRMRDSGQLEPPSPAEPEDRATGATRESIRRHDWKSEAARLRAPDVLKDAKFEATRGSIPGTALEMQYPG